LLERITASRFQEVVVVAGHSRLVSEESQPIISSSSEEQGTADVY
jgi:hypothetical protein